MSQQKEPLSPMKPQSPSKPGFFDSAMDPKSRYQAPPLYKRAGKLKGKAALTTGGDLGIDRSVAVLYAREGADVSIVFLDAEQTDAEETKSTVESEGRKCLLLSGDVKDPAICREAVEKTVAKFGRLNVSSTMPPINRPQKSWKTFRTSSSISHSAGIVTAIFNAVAPIPLVLAPLLVRGLWGKQPEDRARK